MKSILSVVGQDKVGIIAKVSKILAEKLGVPFGIVDLLLVPTAALAMLNDAVKKGGLMACNHIGDLSDAFIPVSKDAEMIKAVENGMLNVSRLEAMTAFCSVGLDMIAIPRDTPATTISGMIVDEAAIGMINNKTTAVRVIPVPGKKIGETVEFGGLLGHAPIMPVSDATSDKMINRGGLIPAPVHSFKN